VKLLTKSQSTILTELFHQSKLISKSGKSNSKEGEVLLRKIIAKSKTGEEYIYGFFIFNGIKFREELDIFGNIAGN